MILDHPVHADPLSGKARAVPHASVTAAVAGARVTAAVTGSAAGRVSAEKGDDRRSFIKPRLFKDRHPRPHLKGAAVHTQLVAR